MREDHFDPGARMDQVLAGAGDMAKAWSRLYRDLVADGVPAPFASMIVASYVNGLARGPNPPND